MWKNLAGEHLTKFTSKCESNHHCKLKPSNQGEEEHPANKQRRNFQKKSTFYREFHISKKKNTHKKKKIFANNTK